MSKALDMSRKIAYVLSGALLLKPSLMKSSRPIMLSRVFLPFLKPDWEAVKRLNFSRCQDSRRFIILSMIFPRQKVSAIGL